MSLYWPDQHVALEIDDDPESMPFDRSQDPQVTVVHVTTDMLHNQDEMIALSQTLARALGAEIPQPTEEWRTSNSALMEALLDSGH